MAVHEWQLFPAGTVPEFTTREWYENREGAAHLEEPISRDRLFATANLVTQMATQYGFDTVVDLGAGDGGLLSLIQRDSIKSWGYDLCPDNVARAKHRDVDVRYGDVINDPIDWGDVAVATEMLEHLVDPHAFVRRISQNVKVLICSSPHDEKPGAAYEYHAWAWDLIGYRELLEQNGFTVMLQGTVYRFQLLAAISKPI